jgi:hypothetical protein
MAQFGSQDVAAMTNHHLSFFLSFSTMFYLTEGNRLGSLTNSVTTTRKKMNDLTGNWIQLLIPFDSSLNNLWATLWDGCHHPLFCCD